MYFRKLDNEYVNDNIGDLAVLEETNERMGWSPLIYD